MSSLDPAEDLLAAARAGDAGAFDTLVQPFHRELHAHCYRMLASVHDADDALQETLLRAWRGLDRYEDRGSMRAWLYRIATNRCLTIAQRRGRRELPTDLGPDSVVTEVEWIEPYPNPPDPEEAALLQEDLSLAFVAALQHLSGLQRAVLLLRDVLSFSAAEAAAHLDTTTASVNSALQRARQTVTTLAPGPEWRNPPSDPAVAELLARYAEAWERRDVDAIVAMLAADATYSMPPLTQWYRGHDEIRTFLIDGPGQDQWRFVPSQANGQPAFGTYLWVDDKEAFVPGGLDVLTIRGTRVVEVVSFLTADLTKFGLPEKIPAER